MKLGGGGQRGSPWGDHTQAALLIQTSPRGFTNNTDYGGSCNTLCIYVFATWQLIAFTLLKPNNTLKSGVSIARLPS